MKVSSLARWLGGSVYAFGIFCILLLLLVWFQIASNIRQDKENTISSAIQRNSNLVVSLEQYALRTIKDADATLRLVSFEFERKDAVPDLQSLLKKGIIDHNYFSGVVVLDERGKIRASNLALEGDQGDFSDREHFRFHLTHRNQLFIGKPILSRTIGKDVIVFSRPISKADGSFGGTVAIQMEPARFTQFYSSANLRKNDIISLIAPDGITYARRTGRIESHGEDISKSPLFGHVAKNVVGTYAAKDAIRGVPTYFSYRKLMHYPMIATVGTSQEDVLADHIRRRTIDLIYGTIISMVIALFFIFIYYLGKQRRAASKIRWEEQKKHEREITRQIIVAQEREREIIGHELHDNVNQVLTAVKLYLEMALKKPEIVSEIIPRSIRHLTDTIHELRNLSRMLSAPTLGARSLIESISSLIEMVSEPSGIKISFHHEGPVDQLNKDQKLTVYRILQEQLNNVVKHARASDVAIRLVVSEDEVELGVTDNGKGFDLLEETGGIGLNNISSRAAIMGGKMILKSEKGEGTFMHVTFPLLLKEAT